MTSREMELTKERAKDVEHHVQHFFERVTDEGNTNLQTEERCTRSLHESNTQLVYSKQPNRELQEVVEKSQSLCMTRHETTSTSPDVDQALPQPQALLCWRNDQHRIDRAEETQELHEEIKMLSAKLQFSTTQREAMIISSAAKLAEVMAANRVLEKEIHAERRLVQAREKEVLNLETRVEALAASNQMLQSMMSLKNTTMDPMMKTVTMMNLEKMAATESTMELKKKTAMEAIEADLLHLAAIASTQNACVVRLSHQNEALHSKVLEGGERSSTLIAERDAAICALEQFKRRMVEWAGDYELLRAYALGLEGDLRESQLQCRFVLHKLEEVRRERDQLVVDGEMRENVLRDREEEVESVGREALRMSLEVELLRRKLRQLDEDVMFKEGQISILRGHSCWRVEFMEGTSAY